MNTVKHDRMRRANIGVMSDNELIAEFMGFSFDPGFNHLSKGQRGRKYSYYTNKRGNSILPNRDKNFDNWDALIKVVEKINRIDMLDFDLSRDDQWLHEKVVTTRVTTEFKTLKKSVVAFIKRYNTLRP